MKFRKRGKNIKKGKLFEKLVQKMYNIWKYFEKEGWLYAICVWFLHAMNC